MIVFRMSCSIPPQYDCKIRYFYSLAAPKLSEMGCLWAILPITGIIIADRYNNSGEEILDIRAWVIIAHTLLCSPINELRDENACLSYFWARGLFDESRRVSHHVYSCIAYISHRLVRIINIGSRNHTSATLNTLFYTKSNYILPIQTHKWASWILSQMLAWAVCLRSLSYWHDWFDNSALNSWLTTRSYIIA